MTIRTPLGYSIAIHVLIAALLIVVELIRTPASIVTDTVRIRVRMPNQTGFLSPGALGGSPDDSEREYRSRSNVAPQGILPSPDTPLESFVTASAGPTVTAPEQSRVPPPPASAALASLPGIDPLEGLDDFPGDQATARSSDLWSLTWENGRERGILSFPEVEYDAFSEASERLLDVQVAITVSEAGDVVSAELVPPGSGDVRIDRYVHNLALRVVMEPRADEGGTQHAVLRLVFLEGRSR